MFSQYWQKEATNNNLIKEFKIRNFEGTVATRKFARGGKQWSSKEGKLKQFNKHL